MSQVGRRVRSFLALPALLLFVSALAGPQRAAAQAPPPASPPTTTRSLLDELVSKLVPTPPRPPSPPPTPVAGAARPPAAAGLPTTAAAPVTCSVAIPAVGGRPGLGAGPRSSAALVDVLQKLSSSLNGADTFAAGLGRFPVAGIARYSNDWMAPRYTPCFHLHQGTDIFAARGTPVRAPTNGVVSFTEEAVGGKSVYVREANGTFYYLAHLDRFARIPAGSRVSQGQVVGFVGSTGNADGGAPHVHLQVHPRGGGPINPKPLLDRWLDEAAAGVPKLAASLQNPLPPPWKAPTSPDWSAIEDQPDAWTTARYAALAVLLPLTPRPLVPLIDS